MASTDPQWRFDHEAAQEAAEEMLAESPVVARVTDPDGDTYDPERVLPDRTQKNVAYLYVLVDQLEQDPRGTGGQLKHEIGQAIAGAYTRGHGAGRDELLAYLAGLDDAELPWVLGSLLSSYQRDESDG